MRKITLFTLLILTGLLSLASGKDRYERLYNESIRTFRTNPDSSIIYAQELSDISDNAGSLDWFLKANYLLGWQYKFNKGDLGKAIIYYMEGLRSSEKATSPEIKYERIQHLRNAASIFWSYDDFERTIKYYESALAISQELDNKLEQVKNFVSLGDVYYDEEEFENLFDTALSLRPSNPDALMEMSDYLARRGEADGADDMRQRALRFNPTLKNSEVGGQTEVDKPAG